MIKWNELIDAAKAAGFLDVEAEGMAILKKDLGKRKMEKVYDLAPGSVIRIGEYEFAVMPFEDPGVPVVLHGVLPDIPFDEDGKNDWRDSTIRDYLKGWMEAEIIPELEDEDVLFYKSQDLTSDDGLKDYGTSQDQCFLITCDQYRKWREFISSVDAWWWTITPYSCPSSGFSYYVRFVNTDGSLYNNCAYSGNIGARPGLFLDPDLLVEVVKDAED